MSDTSNPPLSPSLLKEIVEVPIDYNGSEQLKTDVKSMVDALSAEELETAARTSYAYWVLSTTNADAAKQGVPSVYAELDQEAARVMMASREARRHLLGEACQVSKGLPRFRKAIQTRQEMKLDLLRTCFHPSADDNIDEEDKKKLDLYRSCVEEEMSLQCMAITGHDKDYRPLGYRLKRTATVKSDEAFLISNLYMMERCIATGEIMSRGTQEKAYAVYDCADYAYANAPTTTAMMKATTLSLATYPERMHKMVVLDLPTFFATLKYMIWPLLPTETQEKVLFLSSATRHKTDEVVEEMMDLDQATNRVHSKGTLTLDIDMEHFLHTVPFHSPYYPPSSSSKKE